jgi:hypothetical protein
MSELTYEAAFPNRFLKAALFDGKKVTLTIKRAYMEELEGEKKKENKLILAFVERDKEIVCNKTNAFCLKEMWGNKIASWVGKRVVLYPTVTMFGPKEVDCIRVYGSPDIKEDVEVSARLGRKNFKTTLHAVKSGKPAAAASKSPDPRILTAWEILDWTREEGAADQAAKALPDAEYLSYLNAAIDKKNSSELMGASA